MIQNDIKNGDKQNTKQPSNDKQMKKLPKPDDIINYCDDDKDYPKPDDTTNQVTEGPIIDENVCEGDDDCPEEEECVDGICSMGLAAEYCTHSKRITSVSVFILIQFMHFCFLFQVYYEYYEETCENDDECWEEEDCINGKCGKT